MVLLKSEDGVSEVISTVLILSITVIGISAITAVGYPIIEDVQDTATFNRIQQSFTLLDSRISKAALGESPKQYIDIKVGDGNISIRNNSWMNITLKNGSSVTTYMNVSLNSLVYELNRNQVAYEAGGIWLKYGDLGSTMLSPPEFHYDGTTLTLPLIRLVGSGSSGGSGTVTIVVDSDNQPVVHFPNSYSNRTNPMSSGTVWVKVRSDYCNAWKSYMEEQTSVSVEGDNCATNSTVLIKLVTPSITNPFTQAIFSSNNVILWNNFDAKSYDSTTTRPSDEALESADIYAASLVLLKNNVNVLGSVNSSGSVTLNNNAEVSGICRGSLVILGTHTICGETVQQSAVAQSMPSVDSTISGKISSFSSSNGNDAAAANPHCGITGTELSISSPDENCIITGPKDLYFTKVYMKNNPDSGKALIFDTSAGPIDIAVFDGSQFKLDGNVNISVIGTNPVRFYLGSNVELDMGSNVCMLINPTESGSGDSTCGKEPPAGALGNTNLLQLWMHSNGGTVELVNNNDFFGVIYAPGRDIELSNNVYVCGATIGDTVDIKNNVHFQYDENLKNIEFLPPDSAVIQYLHISENVLSVDL